VIESAHEEVFRICGGCCGHRVLGTLGFLYDKLYEKVADCEELLKEIRDILSKRLPGSFRGFSGVTVCFCATSAFRRNADDDGSTATDGIVVFRFVPRK
jgi:hypothetical protein